LHDSPSKLLCFQGCAWLPKEDWLREQLVGRSSHEFLAKLAAARMTSITSPSAVSRRFLQRIEAELGFYQLKEPERSNDLVERRLPTHISPLSTNEAPSSSLYHQRTLPIHQPTLTTLVTCICTLDRSKITTPQHLLSKLSPLFSLRESKISAT
jgi:hypothetical protein